MRPTASDTTGNVIIVIVLLLAACAGLVFGLVNIYSEFKSTQAQLAVREVTIGQTDTTEKDTMIDSLRQSLDGALDQNKSLSSRVEELSAALSQMRRSVGDKDAQINFLIAEGTRLEADLRSRVADYETSIGNLKARIDELSGRFEEAQTMASSTVGQLQDEITGLEAELENERQQQADLEHTLAELSYDNLVIETASMHYNLANLYLENKKIDDAVKEYRRALALCPTDADAHYNLALVCDIYTHDYATALDHYRNVLELQPAFPRHKEIEERIVGLALKESVQISPTLATRRDDHKLTLDTVRVR